MINTLYLPELREMLELSDLDGLREFCTALHPARTAEFMEGLTAAESWTVLQAADPPTRVAIFGYLDRQKQIEIIETCDAESVAPLIADMPPDDRVDLLNAIEPEIATSITTLLPLDARRDIQRLQSYAEGTAGAMMTTDVAHLPESLTVREALEALSKIAEHLETIYYIYIVDDENHLRGAISARQLVTHLGKPNMPIRDLMERDLVTVQALDDQEAVAKKVADYDFLAIPVVDHEQHLVGVITHDDVIDVFREEATEDALRMAAVEPMLENYLELPFRTIWRKRSMWLACLFVAELFTFTALAYFENEIAAVLVLSLFVPLCISTGGNSGSQAATLITRAMALGHVGPSEWWNILKHELAMGVALGVTLGCIGFVRAMTTPQSVLDATEYHEEAIDVVMPNTAELVSKNGKLELPVGSQLTRAKLDHAAIATLPAGGQVDRIQQTPDSVIYRLPPNTEIRFPTNIRWNLSLVVAQSVAAICLWGTLVGSMLPLLFRKLGFDPGYASSPFVATFVDVTGIVIYFTIAHIWLL
ncbi:MAG TPA: magnesium transporter [Lacipirellulaceae bacterium]|nr:magnesium transporter [Lacipirellulaceae bacterium]